ncbi:MAG: alpha/beta fold hydrolase [Candidatus Lambdaproteobacteria bacterium]|nr:alpha/beta fold hydrolase [Candidatus Lambdaproteobacteria bacterium]
MDWIESNGTSLRYDLGGAGSKTLVLVHEVGGCIESWDETLPGLQREFRVLRYDQRGFGFSEKVLGALTVEMICADLAGLLDGLRITTPVLLIGSAGGADITLAFAARHPKRVGRLVLCCPATGPAAGWSGRLEERAKTVETQGMRAVVEESHARSYPAVLRGAAGGGDAARYERYRRRWLANDPQSFAALGRMMAKNDLSGDLKRIACPTLVCGATHDALRTPAMVEGLAKQIPGATYTLVDSGHFMPLQTPDRFVAAVLPFLKAS